MKKLESHHVGGLELDAAERFDARLSEAPAADWRRTACLTSAPRLVSRVPAKPRPQASGNRFSKDSCPFRVEMSSVSKELRSQSSPWQRIVEIYVLEGGSRR